MDTRRATHQTELMQRFGYQALVCRIPEHVLMFTGYAPVLGASFCIVSLKAGALPEVRLVVPEQEADLLPEDAAVEVKTFAEEGMDFISTAIEAAREPLAAFFHAAGLSSQATIGYETANAPIITNYTQSGVPGPATLAMLKQALPDARWREATSILSELASIKTEPELAAIHRAIEVGHQGFLAARTAIRPGVTEAEVAAATSAALLQAGHICSSKGLVTPHVHVMAGRRAAQAFKAFNLTTNARIERGDTVLVQMEVGIDGYWAELTRTFFAGEARPEWTRAHQACLDAQQAALQIIRAGISGRAADTAARQVMQRTDFGDAFKHGLGHGCGFQAIHHAAPPVLHPASQDTLQSGMVHNLEPAVYLDGQGGFRLNDTVVVQPHGNAMLSAAIPRDLDWLVAQGQSRVGVD